MELLTQQQHTKTCTKCGVTHPLEGFSKHPETRDGLQTTCRDCTRISNRLYMRRIRREAKERQLAS